MKKSTRAINQTAAINMAKNTTVKNETKLRLYMDKIGKPVKQKGKKK